MIQLRIMHVSLLKVKNYILRLFSLILIVLVFLPFFAQGQQYNFRNFTVKDGVAQSQVYSLHQDFRGYLWFGTRGGGITRFDGLSFKTFTEKDGLVNNYVFKIKEDSHHNLWIGTNNGISQYNGISFKNYLPSNLSAQLMVLDMAFDSGNRKWLATNQGVMLFDGTNFTNVSQLIDEEEAMVNAIHIDKNGIIWYGTGKGLFSIAEKNGQFSLTRYGERSRYMLNAITSIREDQEGKLWIGTYGDGMYCYNKKSFYRVDLNQELYKQTVLDIYFDKKNNVWIGTLNKGVGQYHTDTKTFSWLTENEGLSNNHVRSIVQDKSGSMWFGTSGGGVCNYFGKQFTNYDKSSGLSGNFIYSIFRDSKQTLWIGTSQKGLSAMRDSRFSSFNASNGFIDAKIKAICEDNLGNVYFGADGEGVFVFDGIEFKPVPGLTKKYVRAMIRDHEGNLWIATAGNGLMKLILDENGSQIKTFNVSKGLLANRLTCLHEDRRGRIWYGTEGNGVGYILNNEPQTTYIRTKNGLRSNAIRSLAEDQSGHLWIGTAGSGIASVALYGGNEPFKITSFGHKEGLTSSNIYLLVIDAKNNLIAGSETGLDYIFLDAQRKITNLKHYSKGDGFTGVETCQNSVFKDDDGIIWFGSINGLSRYNPANSVKNETEPITNITEVKLFYESLSKTRYKDAIGDWNQVSFIHLPYDQNHLSFDFFAINFSNPDAVQYKWKLLGFDKDWSPPSKEHSILYSNLNPGKYTFLVKAANEDGVWNEQPVKVSFQIDAPFWLTWWFVMLEGFTISLLIFLVFKWQANRIRAKAAEEQKKLQMAKEIVELEQKTLRLQMNPHFIFNALNSIQSNIGTGNEKEARYYLAKFSRLMRQILDNSRNTQITLEEEIETLENYLLIEKFCNGDRFDYEIKTDENLEIDYLKIPPMLLQPFVENAIKHGMKNIDPLQTEPSERGKIIVEFREKGNLLECSVTDNGIGRSKAEELNKNSKETYHKSMALTVTQERLDLLQESDAFQALQIIDLYDANGNAAGTKVILRIPMA